MSECKQVSDHNPVPIWKILTIAVIATFVAAIIIHFFVIIFTDNPDKKIARAERQIAKAEYDIAVNREIINHNIKINSINKDK